MLEQILKPFDRQRGSSRQLLDAWRCCMFVNGVQCKRVELSYKKILVHLAVEHGVRRVKNGIEIRKA